jgi:meso-butanediol dehydrogenase/(S,S)-butanediol dehydrogenase/diacetyl reductase
MGERLRDKATIVTGAGSGLGRALTLRFAAEGARVLAADVSGAEEQVAAEAQGEVVPIHCDVTSEDEVVALLDRCRERFGRLDVLCNNAGIFQPQLRLHECGLDVFDRVLDVNVRGAFLVLKHSLAAMVEQGGRGAIVNTASISAFHPNRGSGAYAASKAALMMLTRVAALEYAGDGIRVNAVCPGTFTTAMSASLTPEHRAFLVSQVPMGRVADPDEIAAVALFLASDEASYVTGQGYLADGGRSAA